MRATLILFALFALLLSVIAVRIQPKHKISDEDFFHSYLQHHKLDFPTEEERAERFQIFKNNLQFLRTFNSKEFTVGLNQFAHLSNQEFRAQYLQKSISTQSGQKTKQSTRRNVCPSTLPQSVDYRGQISPVKDQGQLGNSLVFATVDSLQDGIEIRNGSSVSLSKQNLIDCAPWPTSFFKWIQQNNGIDTEASYPSTGQPGPCKFNPNTVGARLPWYQDVILGNETDLACAVAGVGPTVVCVDASQSSFQFYTGGVYYDPSCTTAVDHCMLAVGYGSTGNAQYWVVKNSWGASWGVGGYILMARNKGNNCGIASFATVPFAVPVV